MCGLDVVPIIINRPARSSTPYLTEIVEPARRLCGECAAIDAESKGHTFLGQPSVARPAE